MNTDNHPKAAPKRLRDKNLVVTFTTYDQSNSEEVVDESKLKLFFDRLEGAKESGAGYDTAHNKVCRKEKVYSLRRALRKGEVPTEEESWEEISGDQVIDLLVELVVEAAWPDGETLEPIRRYRASKSTPRPQANSVTAQELLDLLLQLVDLKRTE